MIKDDQTQNKSVGRTRVAPYSSEKDREEKKKREERVRELEEKEISPLYNFIMSSPLKMMM